MRLIVKNGTVVSPTSQIEADVLCENGRVLDLLPRGKNSDAEEIVDASGKFVLSGIIDPHVHSRDPGLTHKEDFEHSTRSAAAGGITTVLEMPNGIPAVTTASILEDRKRQFEARAYTDFGLWGMVTGQESRDDLVALRSAGAVAAKLFWGYTLNRETGSLIYNLQDFEGLDVIPPATNGDLWNLLQGAAEADLLIGVHCEDVSITAAAGQAVPGPVQTAEELVTARPSVAESVAVATLVEIALTTSARVHVVHVSSARTARIVELAQQDGAPITAETCPHYLSIGVPDLRSNKVYPPIKGDDEAQELWEYVRKGVIDSIGSDHAPHAIPELSQPFEQRPAGVVSTETMVRVLLDHCANGRISLERLACVLSESTAKLYGLYPQKGCIEPGSDADLTIVDLDREWTIRNSELHSKNPRSPWDGVKGRGLPVATVLRGRVSMWNGRPPQQALGRFVKPESQIAEAMT